MPVTEGCNRKAFLFLSSTQSNFVSANEQAEFCNTASFHLCKSLLSIRHLPHAVKLGCFLIIMLLHSSSSVVTLHSRTHAFLSESFLSAMLPRYMVKWQGKQTTRELTQSQSRSRVCGNDLDTKEK